jgi:hypothetical protein
MLCEGFFEGKLRRVLICIAKAGLELEILLPQPPEYSLGLHVYTNMSSYYVSFSVFCDIHCVVVVIIITIITSKPINTFEIV